MRVALFINSTAAIYSQTDQILSDDVVHYSGQRKRKTFDNWFAPEKQTEFFVFRRNLFGWYFFGKARSVRQVDERTEDNPPVWVLKLEAKQSEPGEAARKSEQSDPKRSPVFVSKEMILEKCGLVSKYKSMATGIIPLQRS